MDHKAFNKVFKEQVKRCEAVLVQKGNEYSTEDKLHNFKKAANLAGVDAATALAGMMAKHSVSIYDMIEKDVWYDMAVWDEKITDHINYLILLKAIVVETQAAAEARKA